MADLSRRTVLTGATLLVGGVASGLAGAVAAGIVPGRDAVVELFDPLPADVPHASPGPFVSGEFDSAARHTRVGWSISYPPGHRPGDRPGLPVVIALHGRGGNHRDAFDAGLHLDRYQAALRSRFAIASVDGGDHGYWHPRATENPAAMILNEFVPLLARRGLDISRLGLLGWSMGGYGALYLTEQLAEKPGAARVRAVVAESPALWAAAAQSASGAFDSAADFNAHSIFPKLRLLAGVALRIDCGDRDGFAPITEKLRAELRPTPAGGIEPGAHDQRYWRSQARAQLGFLGQHLR